MHLPRETPGWPAEEMKLSLQMAQSVRKLEAHAHSLSNILTCCREVPLGGGPLRGPCPMQAPPSSSCLALEVTVGLPAHPGGGGSRQGDWLKVIPQTVGNWGWGWGDDFALDSALLRALDHLLPPASCS